MILSLFEVDQTKQTVTAISQLLAKSARYSVKTFFLWRSPQKELKICPTSLLEIKNINHTQLEF